MTETFFTAITLFVVVVIMVSEWFNAKGRLDITYPLGILKFIGFFVLEGALALNSTEQKALILFVFVDTWGAIMNFRGWRRLKQEATETKQ